MGSMRGFDMVQLQDRISAVCQVADVYGRNPELNRNSRRLNATFDKVNTHSWTGCTSTAHINFRQCWDQGAHQAKAVLRRHGIYNGAETDFAALALIAGEDLMRPSGFLAGHAEVDDG